MKCPEEFPAIRFAQGDKGIPVGIKSDVRNFYLQPTQLDLEIWRNRVVVEDGVYTIKCPNGNHCGMTFVVIRNTLDYLHR